LLVFEDRISVVRQGMFSQGVSSLRSWRSVRQDSFMRRGQVDCVIK